MDVDLIQKVQSNPSFSSDDWDNPSKNNRTPISYAVHPRKKGALSRKHFLIVQKWIEKKADINNVSSHNKNIVSYALDNDLNQPVAQDILIYLLEQGKNIASSIENLDLSQYIQLCQFILNRPSTAASRSPIIKLNDRLVKMLESPKEYNKHDNPLIEYLKNTAQDQKNPVFSLLKNMLHANNATKHPMVLAIRQNRIDVIEALLPYQSIDEHSLRFWQMCLAAVCENQNVKILQLMGQKLRQSEDTTILPKLLKTPLDKHQTKTALFYAIDHGLKKMMKPLLLLLL